MRYFLVHETPHMDQMMLLVIINLERGSPVGMILAKTLNDLEAIHKGEEIFFTRVLSSFRYDP